MSDFGMRVIKVELKAWCLCINLSKKCTRKNTKFGWKIQITRTKQEEKELYLCDSYHTEQQLQPNFPLFPHTCSDVSSKIS